MEFTEPIYLSENADNLIFLSQNDMNIKINLRSIHNKLIITPLELIDNNSFVDLIIGQGALLTSSDTGNKAEAYSIYVGTGLYGDIDQNKVVNTLDLAALAQSYNESIDSCVTWNKIKDMNRDGVIDIYDMTIITGYLQ
ncbi:MAG: hypothetical protein GX306_06885 [Clostridiales bacterium]|nr:hypothetical protein [Clostridiales bacterium]